jgi:ABC-2 type transport system ATP-binding protein
MVIIEVDGLTKTFRSRERASGLAASLRSFVAPCYREREAVKQISFSLEAGEVLAFIGPNGAGKSTTIKMLTGILYPTAGKAQVLGFVPWKQRRTLAYSISSLFGQKSQLWYHLPPQDTFDLLAHIYELDMTEYRKRRAFLIDVFDIAEYMSTPVRKLSLGERMRCELAAALLHKPQVLFLDEPTIGLDVLAKQRIRDLIGQLNTEERVTVFLTSHDAGDIEQVCRRAIVINHGEIILDAPVSTLKRDYLKAKTVELLLDEPVETLLETDSESGKQRLSIQVPSSVYEELHDREGVQILKAKGHELQLEVDTSRSPLEPIIAAIMQRCHILDMTITDPPMEEIIAAIYSEQRQEEEEHEVYTDEHDDDTILAAVSPGESQEGQKLGQDTVASENTTHEEEKMLYSATNVKRLHEETVPDKF